MSRIEIAFCQKRAHRSIPKQESKAATEAERRIEAEKEKQRQAEGRKWAMICAAHNLIKLAKAA